MRSQTKTGSEIYFAAIPKDNPTLLAAEMQSKITEFRKYCASNGLMGLWEKKLVNYYGTSAGGNSSQAVTQGGSQGELSLIKVNDLHNLIQNQLVIVTSQRPAGIARAENSDTECLKASRIGTAVAEFYMTEMGFEQKFLTVTEAALLCDEAYLDLFWDKDAGDEIATDPDTGEILRSGDLKLRTYCAWNACRDMGLPIADQHWNILTSKGNKYDYAAKYPKFAQQILACGQDNLPSVPFDTIPDGSDAIYSHLLVHDRTAAVPEGRYALLIGDSIVFDMELPYVDYPIERIAPSDVIDGPIGYSAANDILALEEVSDALNSIITTNQINFGGNTIVGPEGANIEHSDLAKGMRYIELPPDMVDKLKVLELTRTAPEIFEYIQYLGMKKEQQVGSNSVVRGQPEGQLSGASGTALALIQTQAISFNSGVQKGYFRLLSSTMTKAIRVLRKYADIDKVAKLVGKSKSRGLKSFHYNGDDLKSIASIVYELVNPMSQTLGGKLTFAQDLLKAGQIKSPKQYLNLAMTGQLDVLTEDDEADGILILEENEALMEGRPVKAQITELHVDHIKSHNSQITQKAKEEDPEFVARVLDHVQEHIDLWMKASMTNPGILMATGQQPLMPPPGMMPPGMAPQGQPPAPPMPGIGGPPAPKPKDMSEMISGGSPTTQKASQVERAQLPNIAGTDQKPMVPGVTDSMMM